MAYSHSNVYIVRVVDHAPDGDTRTWHVGPYGATRADQTADHLVALASDQRADGGHRECFVEALFSDEECLRVDDYVRAELGSLS